MDNKNGQGQTRGVTHKQATDGLGGAGSAPHEFEDLTAETLLASPTGAAGVAQLLGGLVSGTSVAVTAYDGTRVGPASPEVTVVIRSADALRRMLTAPGQLGFARAYVAGDIDVVGDIYPVLQLQHRLKSEGLTASRLVTLLRLLREAGGVGRPLPPPPEEARVSGRLHSRRRDAQAISHHYDVSNDFYSLLLGPSMTYSCATWSSPSVGLQAAQEAKYELVSRKLGLRSGMRLLDVGCGWGGMVIHAARHHGVHATGVTLSAEQADYASRRVNEEGLRDQITIRLQDYRDISDGPYDAISSIGMFEHVGENRLAEYFSRMHVLLASGGRLLNHGITRPAGSQPLGHKGFIPRYVFPDGELHEIGSVVTRVQHAGLEVRHCESLREHYALTLRAWVENLERHYDQAVALVGEGRARVWRLYLAGSALGFEAGEIEVHQVLAVRPDHGRSGLPLRPDWG